MNTRSPKDEDGHADLLTAVADATSLREGPEGVAQILHRIYSAGTISLKNLSRKSGIPLPVLAALRRELERVNVVDRGAGGIRLTQEGVGFIENRLNIRTKHDATCPTCRGKQIVIPQEIRPALEKLERYFNQRPPVDVTLDQTPVLPESSIRRALYMYQSGALEGKSVILLGEDDSVSLAIRLIGQALGREDFCKRLTVVEADARIIDFIRGVSAAESFEIECVSHDLRDPLPKRLRQEFDTFETDPPYTLGGLNLFVSRALTALKPGAGRQGFLSFGAKAPDESLEIQRSLAAMGLVINQVNHFFNEYQGASILGGSSQLVHLLTGQSTAPVVPESRYDFAIYTGELAPTKRMYRCTNCKAMIEVGRGHDFNTIESLKGRGCPKCGNAQFRYAGRADDQSAKNAAGIGEIRPARKEDLPAIVDFEIEIARISFPEDPITDPEVHRGKLSKIMEREPEGMYVMASEGRVIGWMWITINTQPLTRRTYGTLRSLAVRRDRRKSGAGRALLEFGIDYCRGNRAEWMVTKVFAENLPMRTLCLSLGFHIKHLSMEMRFDA
ncbi:MAG TPA: GNAT family N-acetyltransferase [Blastocatellia bacterium]|jgi:predicted methyltransferase/L-amino acid N-acyltransferase YncA|nr:GNAT family N-acetyltransferase [Blastocatellia bacterium]